MLKRAAYERLVSWKKDPHHRALLVDGARQVGKTYYVLLVQGNRVVKLSCDQPLEME